MKIPDLVNRVEYWFEELEAAKQTGFEEVVVAHLVKLRELLNSQPELEAGGAAETKKTDEDSEG